MKNTLPLVSVLIPCRNEESTLARVLEAFLEQTYPLDRMEILVADGQSTDRTREVFATFTRAHPTLPAMLLDNPGMTAPTALNVCIRKATGDILLRMDAHVVPAADYVERCVELLQSTGCEGVGGLIDIQPGDETKIAHAIAAIAVNPFSTGGARYRAGGKAGYVETVPFGAYRRELIDKVGLFNEAVPVNEDFEFNYRIRKSGGKLWFDPSIRSRYIARTRVSAMIRQYFIYGRQKSITLTLHPGSLKIRQAIPAVFLPSLLILGIGAFLWRPFAFLLAAEAVLYFFPAAGFGIWDAFRRKWWELALLLPVFFPLIHLAWGAGFWYGMIRIAWQSIRGRTG